MCKNLQYINKIPEIPREFSRNPKAFLSEDLFIPYIILETNSGNTVANYRLYAAGCVDKRFFANRKRHRRYQKCKTTSTATTPALGDC